MVDRVRRRVLAGVVGGVAAALAGCTFEGEESTATPTPSEVSVTVRLRNRDDVAHPYEAVVTRSGAEERATYSMDGVLAPDVDEYIEMVARFRPRRGDDYRVAISTDGGQREYTWDPFECGDLLVEAEVSDGMPSMEPSCR